MPGRPVAQLVLLTAAAAAAMPSFTSLLPTLPPTLDAILAARGMREPTPIQRAALPRVAASESVLLHAETGSGKSLAFLLPVLANMRADEAMLVVAPTRELAVQLASDASSLLEACTRARDPDSAAEATPVPAPDAEATAGRRRTRSLRSRDQDAEAARPPASPVQIVAVGATPEPAALAGASVVTCTPLEMLQLVLGEDEHADASAYFLRRLRALALDELDSLLPVSQTYGVGAAAKKRRQNKREAEAPAQVLVRAVLEASPSRDLQLLAASATASRPSRLKLGRVLRRDPLGRWFETTPPIIRPADLDAAEMSTVPRAVTVPSCVRHRFVRLPAAATSKALGAEGSADGSKMGITGKRKLTRAERRAAAEARAVAGAKAAAAQRTHPMLIALNETVAQLRPSSCLVFLCRSSHLSVRRAARQLRDLGLPAVAVHEAIGLEHSSADASAEFADAADTSALLQRRHADVARSFRSRRDTADADADGRGLDGTMLVTFEDMARGLHFDGVEVVFIIGLPDSPSTYLHLAGRTGRQPYLDGTVVTLCGGNAPAQLLSWRERLGGVEMEECHVDGMVERVEAELAQRRDMRRDRKAPRLR